jgi:hypothetical protein
MNSVFTVLFSLINYSVGKQVVALVVHYLFLLPALFTGAYLAGDTYCVLKTLIVKEPEDAIAWSV